MRDWEGSSWKSYVGGIGKVEDFKHVWLRRRAHFKNKHIRGTEHDGGLGGKAREAQLRECEIWREKIPGQLVERC